MGHPVRIKFTKNSFARSNLPNNYEQIWPFENKQTNEQRKNNQNITDVANVETRR